MKSKIVLCAMVLAAGCYRPANADVRIGVGIALPGIQLGINVPAYPRLLPVPGYPVYYAPYLDANLFFYDGYYWVFADGSWYHSTWYDGPWTLVAPDYVPYYLLRVPVSYYRRPPPFFRGWNSRFAPRWGEHFGYSWRERHRDWDRWDRGAIPPRAPLPTYQRNFHGPRYPSAPEQRRLQDHYYHYQGQPGRYRGPAPQGPGPRGPGGRGQPEGRRQAPMYRAPPGGPRPQAQQRREGRPGPGSKEDQPRGGPPRA